ncbi:MAG: transposase [Chloroflexi bacterium]|nr:transposase [Chloroflexota bacterium]
MKGIPYGRYTKELREEAVKLVTAEKLSLNEAARRLSLPPSTLANWVKACKAGKLGDVFGLASKRLSTRWRLVALIGLII